jgi:hypothetical protein
MDVDNTNMRFRYRAEKNMAATLVDSQHDGLACQIDCLRCINLLSRVWRWRALEPIL